MPVQVINGVGTAGIRGSGSTQSQSVSFDSDAQAFITSASLTATTQQNAVNDLVLDLKASGIWTKMKALYPMVGGTAASHKWNLKDPRDVDAAYRLVFNGGGTHSSSGYLPNGSNAYGDSKLIPSTSLSLNNTHLSFYSRTNIGSTLDMGAYVANPSVSRLYIGCRGSLSNIMWFGNNSSTEVSTSNTDGGGLYLNTRISSTTMSLFRNSSKFSSNTNSNVLGTRAVYIGGVNAEGGNFYGSKECAFASIGDGLTDIESNLFYQIVEKFQYALGRNVNTSQSFYYDRNYSNQTNAFIFNAGITGTTQQNAIVNLVNNLTSSGLLSKMKAVYPMVGGTANSHKFNLVNPVDTDSAFRLTFNGGWTHSSSGATPNGSNAYADSFFIPSSNLNTTTFSHLSYYSLTNSSITTDVVMGAYNSVGSFGNFSLYARRDYYAYANDYPSTILYRDASLLGTHNTTGFAVGSLTGNNIKIFRNNGLIAQNTTGRIGGAILSTQKMYIGSMNQNGSPTQYTDKQCAFASIGDGLTDLESNLFYQIVERYQYELGRNINVNQSFYYSSGYTNETNAFIFNGGVTDSTQISAVNTLVSTLKTSGIWSKMKAVYPMVGGTPISHKFNLVNPVDNDSAFRLVFNGGWTHSSSGVTPNGSNGYADTFLINSSVLTLNNTHLSFYSRATSNSVGNSMDIGCTWQNSSATQVYLHYHSNGRALDNNALAALTCSEANRVVVSQTNPKGLMISSRVSTSSLKLYQDGLVKGSNTNANTSTYNGLPQNATTIGAIRQYNGISTIYSFYSTKECAFASIGDGLTDAEALTFYNAVQTFQTTLGRQV